MRGPIYFVRSARFPFFSIAIYVGDYTWKYLWPVVPLKGSAHDR